MDDIGPEVFQDTSESPEVTCVCQYIKVPLQPKFNGLNPQGVGLLTDTLQVLFWRSPVRKEHLVTPQAQSVCQLQGVLGRPCPLPVAKEVEDFHILLLLIRNNNDITFHKFRQASSSSGFSQSFLREDSLAIAVSNLSFTIFVFRKRTKSNISSRRGSGTCSISLASNSFLLMVFTSLNLDKRILLHTP